MKARVQKWGNSLAVRIPKPFAEQAGLVEDAPIEMSLSEGGLFIEAAVEQNITLDELLAGVTDENLHDETDFGPAVGSEVW